MKLRKLLALVMATTLLVTAVTGCGGSGEDLNGEVKEEIVVNPHVHEFGQATCTEVSKCSCGETQGTALGHELVDGTCTVCGVAPKYNIGNLMILGDSYSTFEGYIPEGNAAYYKNGQQWYTGVVSVEHTWWKQFVENTKANLVLNESYSGSTICNTGYNGQPCPFTSFIGRFDKLVSNGYFTEHQIDTILIFGGTNDAWADSPIGEPMYSDWDRRDTLSFLPAFCYLLDSIKNNVPNARVVCVINNGLSTKITNGMMDVCKSYGVEFVSLSDISKMEGHPTIAGMAQIEKQIRRVFEETRE